MLKPQRSPDGVELACGRLNELLRVAGSDLGRWMIALAERHAADSCRRRTLETVGSGQKAGSRIGQLSAHRRLPTEVRP